MGLNKIKNYLNYGIKVCFKKKEGLVNKLSDEILMALSAQEDNFIQLYPNSKFDYFL